MSKLSKKYKQNVRDYQNDRDFFLAKAEHALIQAENVATSTEDFIQVAHAWASFVEVYLDLNYDFYVPEEDPEDTVSWTEYQPGYY